MLNICSLFQKFFGFIKSLDKRLYRTHAVIISGIAMVAVICLGEKDFGGSGKNVPQKLISAGTVSEDDTDVEEDNFTASLIPVEQELVGVNDFTYDIENETQENVQEHELTAKSETQLTESQMTETQMTETQITETQMTETQITETQITEAQETEAQETESQITETRIPTENVTQNNEEAVTGQTLIYNSVDFEVTDSDYYWLKKIVEAEAGNQDEIGKILVANVIINRVKSGEFPNSIKSVIFQNNGRTYQFEPVKNERIYDMNPTENTINCVDRALNGEDYSEGALFFTMKTSKKSWFNTKLDFLFKHGDHYFYTY